MLAHTQNLFLRYDFVARGLNHFFELPGKINRVILFLFLPEDTSGTEGTKKRAQLITYSAIHITGFVKALFWIAFSISLASLVGRLS